MPIAGNYLVGVIEFEPRCSLASFDPATAELPGDLFNLLDSLAATSGSLAEQVTGAAAGSAVPTLKVCEAYQGAAAWHATGDSSGRFEAEAIVEADLVKLEADLAREVRRLRRRMTNRLGSPAAV